MLSREEVLKIATLARLKLTDEEISSYQTMLGRVLDYVKELEKVPNESNAFVKHVPKDCISLREDKEKEFPYTDLLFKNAPEKDKNQFLVPPILEHN